MPPECVRDAREMPGAMERPAALLRSIAFPARLSITERAGGAEVAHSVARDVRNFYVDTYRVRCVTVSQGRPSYGGGGPSTNSISYFSPTANTLAMSGAAGSGNVIDVAGSPISAA